MSARDVLIKRGKQDIWLNPEERADAILSALSATPPPSALMAQKDSIDRLFAADRYEDFLDALRRDTSDWAAKQIALLATKSPQTVKVALKQLTMGAAFTDFA